MKFKYRIKGKVDKQFGFKGLIFPIGKEFDLYLFREDELSFIKEHSVNVEIIDLNQKIEPLETMLEQKNEKVEVSNERKRKSNSNKTKNKRNI